jgi:hypothetical protein
MNSRQTVESSGDAARPVLPARLHVERDRLGTAVESCWVEGAVVRVLSRMLPRLVFRDDVRMIE